MGIMQGKISHNTKVYFKSSERLLSIKHVGKYDVRSYLTADPSVLQILYVRVLIPAFTSYKLLKILKYSFSSMLIDVAALELF
jgi:hypothetical protein